MLSKYIDDKQIDMVAKIENVVNKLIADNKYNVFEKQIDALIDLKIDFNTFIKVCLLYTSPSPRDVEESRMPSSA